MSLVEDCPKILISGDSAMLVRTMLSHRASDIGPPEV